MTEAIDGYERVHPEQTLWICPECGGALDPLGDPERAEERNEVDWREEPERWADEPAVECLYCGQRYRVRFEPVDC